MKTKIMAGGAVLGACALAFAAKDPVIMTVNGVDVPRSEFEYLYHKNSQQQLSPQTIDDYAEMFKLYKMKVAAALDEGIDTIGAFRKEMAQYRAELSAPYLADSTLLLNLVNEVVGRSAEEAELKHIMVFKGRTPDDDEAARVRIDSIRKALIEGADFETLARKVSEDRSVEANGGNLGFITVNRVPYNVETAAFSLSEGEISDVVMSPMAYHVLQGGAHRPARGQVHVSHIMKMVKPGASAEEDAKAKNVIDSIHALVLSEPSRFEEVAMKASDDKGSARQGGQLPWFGTGEMVPEFDSVAFAIPDGTISAPLRSQYGWHIIKKYGHRSGPSLEEMKPMLLQRFSNPQDDRYNIIRDAQTKRLASKFKAKVNESNLSALKADASVNGLDSAFYARYAQKPQSDLVIATIGKTPVTAGGFVASLNGAFQPSPAFAAKAIDNAFPGYYNRQLVDAELDWLYANESDYRNLINEYHDGSLLYEISVRKVWDKASKDTEGLDAFFKAHRDDYKWSEPRVKGYLVQAANDSVAQALRQRLPQLGGDTIISTVRKEFRGVAQIDRVLVPKGQNAMVDNLMFGAPKAEPSNSKYTEYFLYNARLINEPEEVADVRGMVTNDYQNALEQEWIADLRNRYPVKVNEKELKKIK